MDIISGISRKVFKKNVSRKKIPVIKKKIITPASGSG